MGLNFSSWGHTEEFLAIFVYVLSLLGFSSASQFLQLSSIFSEYASLSISFSWLC